MQKIDEGEFMVKDHVISAACGSFRCVKRQNTAKNPMGNHIPGNEEKLNQKKRKEKTLKHSTASSEFLVVSSIV